MHVLPYVLFHACHQCILKYLASRHPIDGHFLHRCRALRSANFAPCSGDISEPSSRVCVVREVRQPPSHGFRGQARIRFAPAVDQPVAGIVLWQAQAFLVKIHKQSRRRCDFVAMSQQQGIVSRIVEMSCQQRKRKTELRDLRPTHVVHPRGVHEIAKEVVDHRAGHLEAPPFEIRVNTHREDILEPVVL